MSTWINDKVKIDFPLPPLLQGLVDEAEEADREQNVEYSGIADAIDVCCKGLVSTGVFTQYQWDLMCRRYPQ